MEVTDTGAQALRMHMLDPFTFKAARAPSKLQIKTALINVKGTKILTTNASGTFHVGLALESIESSAAGLQHSNSATSTFDGTADVTSDPMVNVMSAPVPNFNTANVQKKIIAAAIKVKYIGRDDEKAGLFYGYTVQRGTSVSLPGDVHTIDNAANYVGFRSTPVENGLINCFSPASHAHFDFVEGGVFSLNAPTPTIKVVGQGLPASKAVVQLEYSYTLEFVPVEGHYDKYEVQYNPYGDIGAQGSLTEAERCRAFPV